MPPPVVWHVALPQRDFGQSQQSTNWKFLLIEVMRSAGSGLLLLLDLCAYWCLVPFASIFASIALVWWASRVSSICAAQSCHTPSEMLCCWPVRLVAAHVQATIWRFSAAMVSLHRMASLPSAVTLDSCIHRRAFCIAASIGLDMPLATSTTHTLNMHILASSQHASLT